MFDEAYDKLGQDEITSILADLNKILDGNVFDPIETTILSIDVPFYPGYRFLNIADHGMHPPLQRFVFQKKNMPDFTVIDWTNETVQKLNDHAPLKINDDNVFEYIRFFFSYVKMSLGLIILCESADNIRWKDEPSSEIKQALNKTIKPLEIKEISKDGTYILQGYMMFKSDLFRCEISVSLDGCVTLPEYEILLENIPVLDHVIGH